MIEARLPDGRTMLLETPLYSLAVFEPWEPPLLGSAGHAPIPDRALWRLRLREVTDGRAVYEHVVPLWRVTVEPWGPGMPRLLGHVEASDEREAHWAAHCRWPNRGGRLRLLRLRSGGLIGMEVS